MNLKYLLALLPLTLGACSYPKAPGIDKDHFIEEEKLVVPPIVEDKPAMPKTADA